ncbi:MAG: response regulator [Bdellovibrionales bacterium]|nr:response regulator [Bdellovibrionales bacterium]
MFDANTLVLVVDDMTTMRKIVIKSCRSMGLTKFLEAADGKLAMQALLNSEEKVGLIISDWNMPNMTGLEFLKAVRANEKYKNAPFLMLTAESETSQVKDAVMSGVDNYVLKPFTPASLKDKVEAVYKKRVGSAA